MAVSKNTDKVVTDPVINSGVDPAALPQDGDVTVQTTLPPETSNTDGSLPSDSILPTDLVLTPEEIAANQAAADAAFKAANDGAEERVAKEEAIPSMTPDELQAEFGWTVGEAISVLRDALSRSWSIHLDKMNDLLDKIEQTSQL